MFYRQRYRSSFHESVPVYVCLIKLVIEFVKKCFVFLLSIAAVPGVLVCILIQVFVLIRIQIQILPNLNGNFYKNSRDIRPFLHLMNDLRPDRT